MRVADALRGRAGHPAHPPLTDLVIGFYAFAALTGTFAALGVLRPATVTAWWLALVSAVVAAIPTAVTGLLDWGHMPKGSPVRSSATRHLTAVLAALGLLVISAVVGYVDWRQQAISWLGFGLTVAGLAVLMMAAWLGGAIVFVHGARVVVVTKPPEPSE